MLHKTVHVEVSGRVQGVAFRHYTKLRAKHLGVTGWVRNRGDGTVEATISGTEEQIEAMIDWFHHGSPSAVVSGVRVAELNVAKPFYAFDIVY